MILTLTGFEGRDRDWVKEMIKIAGAKYTSYFTRHNHAIICKRYEVLIMIDILKKKNKNGIIFKILPF